MGCPLDCYVTKGQVNAMPSATIAVEPAVIKLAPLWFDGIVSAQVGPDFDHGVLSTISASMGSQGWALPSWMHQTELATIAASPPADWDSHFVGRYEGNAGADRKALWDSMHRTADELGWTALIADLQVAMDNHLYRLVVPTSFLALEGITRSFHPSQQRSVSLAATMNTIKVSHKPGLIIAAVAESLEHAFTALFASAPFSGPPPTVVNRHWLLHGVDVSGCTNINSWRLLQALDHLLVLRSIVHAV
jgi:hypothetical protein